MIKLGEKIKELRKKKGISQEVLANHLGVSFQAVSKWETEVTMPDVILIPAIASFFGVSTDELFDFNIYEIERNVNKIVDEHRKYFNTDIAKSEQILREGLKKYPGNDTLLNCLINILTEMKRYSEVISLAKSLIEGTRCEEIRLDAYRILAEAYKFMGEYELCKDAINNIPEIYFSNLYVKAYLLDGKDKLEASIKEASVCFEHLVWMLEISAELYLENGEKEKAKIMYNQALGVLKSFENDFETDYTHSKADFEKINAIQKKLDLIK